MLYCSIYIEYKIFCFFDLFINLPLIVYIGTSYWPTECCLVTWLDWTMVYLFVGVVHWWYVWSERA